MTKRSSCVLASVVVSGTLLVLTTDSADAVPPFKNQWDATYMKDGSAMHKALNGKSNCHVCHAPGKDRKMRNAYGMALDKLLDRKTDAKNAEKIQDALKKVSEQPSDPKDKDSATFGKLIEEGKLPITAE